MGTTITTQLVAFKVLNIAPYILVIGFIITNVNHKYNKIKHLGKPIFYFGLLFSCLYIISVLTSTLQENAFLLSLIDKTSNLFFAIGAGIILSIALQSSSMATSLVVIFVSGGLLSFPQAFGIILGTNIGTTTTTLLASMITGKGGKRVAMAHFLFNFLGVIIFLPFVGVFSRLISHINIALPGQVALSHLIFNVIIAIIFILAIKPFTKLVYSSVK